MYQGKNIAVVVPTYCRPSVYACSLVGTLDNAFVVDTVRSST
jgi:hypothetical protein